MNNSKKNIGILLAVLGASCWGISGVSSQFLFSHQSISPVCLVGLRLFVAGFLALVIAYLNPKNRQAFWQIWRDPASRKRLLLFSMFGFLPSQLSYFLSINYGNVAAAAALQFLSPTFTLFFMILFQHHRPQMIEIITISLSFIGTIFLITNGNLAMLAISTLAIFWGILSGVGQVAYSILPKPLLKQFPATIVVGWGMFLGGIPLLPVCLSRHNTLQQLTSWEWTNVFFVILVGTLLACLFYISSLKYLSATLSQMLGSFEPLTATVFSIIFLGQQMGLVELLGILLIVSVVLIQKKPTVRQPVSTRISN
ncbi:DMT family transporter [Fructobacillus pseudoficulneus]|uniref:DMT family transporter n=1 Tax=Fructobacillus pseudoficulneus TaxID=220714 RepID=UPI000750AD23|nr:DMT family transporter [Fructobacillus pseudoficulneus]SEH35839.1 Threonine/homoserine efflux transporter RhtA [Fructobacillus pseudoficulneus]